MKFHVFTFNITDLGKNLFYDMYISILAGLATKLNKDI